jgi:hypothetical protein
MNEWSSYELDILLPTEVDRNLSAPDLHLDELLATKPGRTDIVRKTLETAMINDVIGEDVKPEDAFLRGHQAISELDKMLHPVVQQPHHLELTLMKRSGRAGSWAVKQIEKAGNIEEGLRMATETFEDRCTHEQKILLDKAIEAMDLGAWLQIFAAVFAKG